jgi:hypothetical protein
MVLMKFTVKDLLNCWNQHHDNKLSLKDIDFEDGYVPTLTGDLPSIQGESSTELCKLVGDIKTDYADGELDTDDGITIFGLVELGTIKPETTVDFKPKEED